MAELVLAGVSHSYQLGRRRRAATPAAEEGSATFALRELDLRWRDGGAYALLGPSGCGKTTLLGILSGLVSPTHGRVLFGGRDVTELSSRERNVAQVFQFPVVYDTMTVLENLAFPLRNRGLPLAKISERVRAIADALELTALLPRRATRLTADEKQVLALGRGLVREDVAAILFDEPLTVIDPHRKWMLRRKLKEIHRQFGHTLIYVTHDQTEALTFADEVVVMNVGTVLQRGTPEELFLRPQHTFVGTFIGSPGMNVVPCRLAQRDGRVAVELAGATLALAPEVRAALPAELGAGAELELGIRPEHLGLRPRVDDGALALTVTAVEDHGRFFIVTGKVGEHSLKVRAARGDELAAAARPGDRLAARPVPERICLYQRGALVAAAALRAGGAVGAAPKEAT